MKVFLTIILMALSISSYATGDILDLDMELQHNTEFLKGHHCVRENLEIVHQFHSGDYLTVIEIAETLKKVGTLDAFAFDLLAEAQYQIGEYEKAIDIYVASRNAKTICRLACRSPGLIEPDLGRAPELYTLSRYFVGANKGEEYTNSIKQADEILLKFCKERNRESDFFKFREYLINAIRYGSPCYKDLWPQ